MRAFLRDMILRPSCYNCKAKGGRSHSDITIADFWGINVEIPEMDDDKGTGLVLINTDKGQAALDWSKLRYKKNTSEQALRHNPAYYRSVVAHPKREEFFSRLEETDSINFLINDCLRPTLKQRLKMLLTRSKLLVKRMLRFEMGANIVNQPEMISIPTMSDNSSVVSITFRNKQQGWKSYRFEIKMRTQIEVKQ